MENWLALGLIAAVAYSISGLTTKIVLDKKYLGLEATSVLEAAVGIAVGFFWALGSLVVYYALIKGADVSRMAPIYNMNTLLVVLGGIFLLHELPDKSQALRVAAGAILITAGGILVSI